MSAETAASQTLVDYIVARPGGPNGGSADTWQTIAARATQAAGRNINVRDLITANVGAGAVPEEINAWLAESGGAVSNDKVNYTFAAGQRLKLPAGTMIPSAAAELSDDGLISSDETSLVLPEIPWSIAAILGIGLLIILLAASAKAGSSGSPRRRHTRRRYAGLLPQSNESKSLVLLGGSALAAYFFVSGKARELVGDLQNLVGMIPSAAKEYLNEVQAAAGQYGFDPAVLFALGWRETKWGTAAELDEAGPTGCGDYTARTGHWLNESGVMIANGPSDLEGLPYASKWRFPSGVSGPFAIPSDGRGWGRGLMQIDYLNSLSMNNAFDPAENILKAAAMLSAKKNYLANRFSNLAPAELLTAAIAAYNHGERNVASNIENGREIDYGTDHGNYSSDVIGHATKWGLSLSEVA